MKKKQKKMLLKKIKEMKKKTQKKTQKKDKKNADTVDNLTYGYTLCHKKYALQLKYSVSNLSQT